MSDARENASPGLDLGPGPVAHHRDLPRFVCYVEARTISRAISVGCGAGCAGYPNSVGTAAIAASATATGLNSTVVRGGELDFSRGVGVDADHGKIGWTTQSCLADAVQDQTGNLIALSTYRGHPVAYPARDDVGGVVHRDVVHTDGRKIIGQCCAGDALKPIIAQSTPFGAARVRERDLSVPTRNQVLDADGADRQMGISQCRQCPDLDVRNVRGLHGDACAIAQRKQAGDGDRIRDSRPRR